MLIRQKIRKSITIIMFFLFPIVFIYLSPWVAIEAPLLEKKLNGSLFTFVFLFLSSMIFGRVWCGWLCPAGGLGEISSCITTKKAKNGIFNFTKWLIWIPWLITVVYTIVKNNVKDIDLFSGTHYGVSGVHLVDFDDRIVPFIAYYSVITLVFVLPFFFGKKAFCHYICWIAPFMIIGRKLSLVLNIHRLQLKSDKNLCISCHICNKKCSMSLNVMEMVHKEQLEHSECILCGECIDSCPKKCIKFKFNRKS